MSDVCTRLKQTHVECRYKNRYGYGEWTCFEAERWTGAGRAVQDGLDPERLARAFHSLAAQHTGLEESDYDEEDMAHFRQEAEETIEAYRAAPPSKPVIGEVGEK